MVPMLMVNSWVQVTLPISVLCDWAHRYFLPISPCCGSHLCFSSDLWYCTSCLMFIGPYIFLKIYLFLCVWLFGSMYISVFHTHAWCLLGSEEDIKSPGSIVIDSCKWLFGFWELNQEPREEKSGLFNHWAISLVQLFIFLREPLTQVPCPLMNWGVFEL